MKYNFLTLGIILAIGFSCTSSSSPESALYQFINKRFAGKVNKEELLLSVTGELSEEISTMDEEEIKTYLEINTLKLKKVKILHKACEQEKCFITYLVSYSTTAGDVEEFKTETKKVAEMKLDDGTWKIAKIDHIKTFHDSLTEIKPLEEN